MTSEDRIILDYMALLNHLSPDLKLRLIMQLTNSLRKEFVRSIPEKGEPWKGLFGAWRDTDEDFKPEIADIYLMIDTIKNVI